MKVVILYASESGTITQKTFGRLQVFINKYLRKVVNIHWPDIVSNSELRKKTGKEPVQKHLRSKNGIGLDTHWEEMMTASPSKHYSGTARPQRKWTTKEHLENRPGKGHVDGGLRVQVEEDGGCSSRRSWMKSSGLWRLYAPLGATRHKSSASIGASVSAVCMGFFQVDI